MWVSHAAVLMGKVARWIFHDELEAAKTAVENARGRCDGWQRKVEELEEELAREKRRTSDLRFNLDAKRKECEWLRETRGGLIDWMKNLQREVDREIGKALKIRSNQSNTEAE